MSAASRERTNGRNDWLLPWSLGDMPRTTGTARVSRRFGVRARPAVNGNLHCCVCACAGESTATIMCAARSGTDLTGGRQTPSGSD